MSNSSLAPPSLPLTLGLNSLATPSTGGSNSYHELTPSPAWDSQPPNPPVAAPWATTPWGDQGTWYQGGMNWTGIPRPPVDCHYLQVQNPQSWTHPCWCLHHHHTLWWSTFCLPMPLPAQLGPLPSLMTRALSVLCRICEKLPWSWALEWRVQPNALESHAQVNQ